MMKMRLTRVVPPLVLLVVCIGAAYAPAHADEEFRTWQEAQASASDNRRAGKYAEARADLEKAWKLAQHDGQRERTQSLMAIVSMSAGDYARARQEYGVLLRMPSEDPDTPRTAQMGIGNSYFFEKKFEQARLEYATVLEIPDVRPAARYIAQRNIGDCYLQERNYAQARAEYAKMLVYKNTEPDAEMGVALDIGRSYVPEGQFARAREELSKVLEMKIGPDVEAGRAGVMESHQQLAQLTIALSYFYEKDYARAKEEYEKALGMARLRPSRRAEAEKQIQLIAQLQKELTPADPADYQEVTRAARKNFDERLYTAAHKGYEDALALAKTPAEKSAALLQLGLIDHREKKYEQARSRWLTVRDMAGVDTLSKLKAQAGIGQTLLIDKRYAEARAEFAPVAASPEADLRLRVSARHFIGTSYLAEKNYAPARREFAAVLVMPTPENLSPEDQKAVLAARESSRLAIAQSYLDEGDRARARQEYEQLLASPDAAPASRTEAEKQLKLIAELEKKPAP